VFGTNEVKNAIDAEGFIDSVGVLRFALTELGSQHFDLDFIAFVIDVPSMKKHYDKLRKFGWRVVTGAMPVYYNEIADGYYKRNINISGCCGMDELLKINVFNLTDVRHALFFAC
jgi:hypothetical protein